MVLVLIYFSLTPTPLDLDGRADKYAHIAGYAVLMFWLVQIFPGGWSRMLLALVLLGFGIGIEVLQAYSGRELQRGDILANAIGIAVGWFAGPPRTFNVLSRLRRSLG
jgi:VanZ family protein